jgi:TonB family protein
MRRLISLIAALLLAGGLALAQKEKAEPSFEPAQVVSTAPAPYPHTSIAEGTVVLEATIGATGSIEAVKVVRGVASLTEVAEHSLRQWRFSPATLDGKPLRATIVVAFTFTRPVVLPQPPKA